MRVLRLIGPRPVLLLRTVVHRVTSRLHLRRLRRTYAARVATVPPDVSLRLPEVDIPPLAELPEELRAAADRLCQEADAVCAHQVDYLGSGPVSLGEQIDWHRDFKSGHRWPAGFYQDVVVTRLDDDSDAKVPWELSRGHQLLTLARAARLTGEPRYADELEAQLASWIAANPPGTGINWTNAMEVAIRAVNWIWALATLAPMRAPSADVAASLAVHGRHIENHLEASPYLRSNHYVADLLGLVALGATVEGDPRASRWLRAGCRGLEREIRHQVNADGFGFEASLPYHGLVLEMLLLARLEAARAGRPMSPGYDERLRAMLAASRAVRHPAGRVPQFGDNDSGRILPAGFARSTSQDHLLWLGAAILGGQAPLDGAPDEEVLWTLGAKSFARVTSLPPAAAVASASFSESGIHVLAAEHGHLVLRNGNVGQGGNGGHAHNDNLSYELSLAGQPLVVDPGTYVYTSDPDARNAMRSTAAHSTLSVDDAEINPIDARSLFTLDQAAEPVLRRFDVAPEPLVEAEHSGYRRLPGGVVHRREVTLSNEGRAVRVRDSLSGDGRHRVVARVQLAPGSEVVENAGGTFVVTAGAATATVSFSDADDVGVADAWVSDTYGVRTRAPVLVASAERELPALTGHTIELVTP